MEIEQSHEIEYGDGADWTGTLTTRWEINKHETTLVHISFERDLADRCGSTEILQDEKALAEIVGEAEAKDSLEFAQRNAESDYNALEPNDGLDRPEE